jgi:glycosyltransferase involved in cell wall biosynthesis
MVIAISDATRSRFSSLFPHYPVSRIRTVHPASRFDAQRAIGPLPSPLKPDGFWLTVGTLEPRKNLRRLAHAFAQLSRDVPDTPPLVIAGGGGWMEGDFDSFLAELGIASRVMRLGYVDDDVLAALYAHCFGFVYPALVEGFGLPVLEAMSLGAPVITSDRPSLVEIAGDAALLVDPGDVRSLSDALNRFIAERELRDVLRCRGRDVARRFSWPHAAATVLSVYREALERPAFRDDAGPERP